MRFLALAAIVAALLVVAWHRDDPAGERADAAARLMAARAPAAPESGAVPDAPPLEPAASPGPAESPGATRAVPAEPSSGGAARVAQAAAPIASAAVEARLGGREAQRESEGPPDGVARLLAAPEYADNVAPVARLYLAFFDRIPDYEGFDHYVVERGRGAALQAIAEEFASSREFDMRYGALDNAAFVDRIHRNVFGDVAPEARSREDWIAQLESGRMTRGEVMLAFSENPAFRLVTENEVFVAMAYAQALQRAPDAADLARWVAFLDAGNPRGAVIDRLLASNRPAGR